MSAGGWDGDDGSSVPRHCEPAWFRAGAAISSSRLYEDQRAGVTGYWVRGRPGCGVARSFDCAQDDTPGWRNPSTALRMTCVLRMACLGRVSMKVLTR